MFMEKFRARDSKFTKGPTYRELEDETGRGGHEVLNYMAFLGAMKGTKSRLQVFEAIGFLVQTLPEMETNIERPLSGSVG
jgi:2,3-dihydroxyphenylpropionate 1,2-dioxygenase